MFINLPVFNLVDNEPLLSTFWNLAQMWMADTKSQAKRPEKIADAWLWNNICSFLVIFSHFCKFYFAHYSRYCVRQ
jgi:hypothetical protein